MHASRTVPFLALALCLTSACLVGAQSGVYYGTIPEPARWQTVPVAGGMTLRIPGPPKVEEGEESDFDGTPIRFTLGRLETSHVLFGFAVLSAEGGFIEDPYERASEVANGDGDDSEWNVRWEESSERDGFRVADRIVDAPEHGASIRFHFVEGKSKIYTLFAGYPTAQETEVSAWVQAYVDGATYPANEATIPRGDGVLQADSWQHIAPPERAFAAEFPGQPNWVHDEHHMKGAVTHIYEVKDAAGTSGYRIAVYEFEGGRPDDGFERVRAMTAPGARGQDEGYVHQRGYAGISVTLQSAERKLRVHYYATAGRIHEMSYYAPPDAFDAESDSASRFLSSFRIF